MALLLSIETSTGVCSAALHEDGKLLVSSEMHIAQSASSALAVMIHDLLKIGGKKTGSLDGVAIAGGPGSYTGLRIGVATAKGICLALGIPLIALNTLELMAHQVIISSLSATADGLGDFVLCPMLDARRMEVYCLVSDRRLTVLEATMARVIDEQSFSSWLTRGKVLFFGNGSGKCREILHDPNAIFIEGVNPVASKMGTLAFQKFESRNFEVLSAYEPYYLKDFVVKKPKSQI